MSRISRSRLGLSMFVLAAAALACAEKQPTGAEQDPTKGLTHSTVEDSSGSPIPQSPPRQDTGKAEPGPGPDTLNAGPGYFRGVVRGSEMVQGPDTLSGSVRIPDVKVAAFKRQANGDAGALVATVVSDSKGEWQLPTITGGEYVVTFTPPSGSKYQGVWVTAVAHNRSHEWPWWVTLPAK